MSFQEEKILSLMDELIESQKGKLLSLGREFVPTLTEEDVLQPVDYPILEENGPFRYEEGMLAGLHTAKSALAFLLKNL